MPKILPLAEVETKVHNLNSYDYPFKVNLTFYRPSAPTKVGEKVIIRTDTIEFYIRPKTQNEKGPQTL